MGLSVLPGLSLCVLGSSGPLGVPPLHPCCPLEGIPSPDVHFGGYPHPLVCFVPCPGHSTAFGCPWSLPVPIGAPHSPQGAFWGAQSLSMEFSVTEPQVCLWAPLHTPGCVSIAWGSLVHPQLSGCALGYPRAPTEPLATTDCRGGIRNTAREG